ncbi:MAG: Ig-like domain-containing protein [Planctomycetota bacterium]|jgi:hypothetical protein
MAISMFSMVGSAAMDDEQGLVVFVVTPEDEEYSIGSTVEVEVHTLLEGEYYPAIVKAFSGNHDFEIALTSAGTGRHTGTFTIAERMTDYYGRVLLWAEAKLNDTTTVVTSDSWYLHPEDGNPFYIDISLGDNEDKTFEPGDEVAIDVNTYFEGDNKIPDENFYVRVYPPSGSSKSIEMWGHFGRYNGTYVIPNDLTVAGTFGISVSGQYTYQISPYIKEYWTYKDTASDTFYVEFFDIWAYLTDITATSSTFDLYVTGKDGEPLEGAEVAYEWEYSDDEADDITYAGSGTTDGRGILTVTLDHDDMGITCGNYELTGTVTHDGRSQEFDGQVWNKDDHFPATGPHDGFGTLCLTDQPLEPGTTTTIEQLVTFEGVPLASQTVYYFFTHMGGVFAHGNATTDEEGRYSVSLDVPTLDREGTDRNRLYAWTQMDAGDGVWRYNRQFLSIGSHPSMYDLDKFIVTVGGSITVTPFSTGDLVNVVVENFFADGVMEEAWLAWGVGQRPDWKTVRNLDWGSWNGGSPNDLMAVSMRWDNGSYKASFTCPWFLEPGDEIYLYGNVYLFEPTGDMDAKSHFTTAIVGPLNPRPTVTLDNLVEGKAYGGIITVKGTASDDASVQFVELRVDGKEWERAVGTDEWTISITTPNHGYGVEEHDIYVRSFDGKKYSEVTNITVVFDQSVEDDDDNGSPGFGAASIIIGMVAIALVVGRRRLR